MSDIEQTLFFKEPGVSEKSSSDLQIVWSATNDEIFKKI